jgi:hypothetical protein
MDFIAFFPGPKAGPVTAFERATGALTRALPGISVSTRKVEGAQLLCVTPKGGKPSVLERDAGFLAVKGMIVDPNGSAEAALPEGMLDAFASGDPKRFGKYEGTFGLASWDGRARRACLAVDQAATICLYAIEAEGGLYASTTPVALAVGLGLGLEPEALRQFLVRGSVTAPLSMFSGLRRFDFGQYAVFENGRLSIQRHWVPFAEPRRISFQAAAAELASIASDRVGRYAKQAGPTVFDMTSGYDSRLMVAAAHKAGVPVAITVNGDRDSLEILAPLQAAERFGWPLHHFVQREVWTRPIDAELLREGLFRTGGEMVATVPYNHIITRPILSEKYRLHMHGASVGSDVARYYTWSQEFTQIGRRQRPNIDRLMRYRFLQGGRPPADLYAADPFPAFDQELRARILDVCKLGEGRRNTEVLDAIHLWKLTGFTSIYTSALYELMPTVPPINSAAYIQAGMTVPLRYKMTTNLVRQVIWNLFPELAKLPTNYGNTAEPARLRSLHRELMQVANRAGHLIGKLDRVYLGGRWTSRLLKNTAPMTRPLPLPFAKDAVRDILRPPAMASRGFYTDQCACLFEDDARWGEPAFLRAVTLELLCRELGIEPGPELLA